MNQQVRDVVAANVEAANRVVDRQRQVDERSTGDGCFRRRRQRFAHGPELSNLLVLDDAGLVVPEKWRRESARVRNETRDNDQQPAEAQHVRMLTASKAASRTIKVRAAFSGSHGMTLVRLSATKTARDPRVLSSGWLSKRLPVGLAITVLIASAGCGQARISYLDRLHPCTSSEAAVDA